MSAQHYLAQPPSPEEHQTGRAGRPEADDGRFDKFHLRPASLHAKPHLDDRGFFSRTFDAEIARQHGIDPETFVQDSLSRSAQGVILGLHLHSGSGEAKIVRCWYGEIFDVVVDLRPGSPTFLQMETFRLRGDTCQSVYVPAGCAHGFQALTDPADVAHRIDRPHDPSEDVAIAFDDPQLAIPWPFPPTCSRIEIGEQSLLPRRWA
jgi:dTDP-4-dehydrorhamnose 3,5-epimerase